MSYVALFYLVLLSPANTLILSYPELVWKAGLHAWLGLAPESGTDLLALILRALAVLPVGWLMASQWVRMDGKAYGLAALAGFCLGVGALMIQMLRLDGWGAALEPLLAAGTAMVGMALGQRFRGLDARQRQRWWRTGALFAVPIFTGFLWRAYGLDAPAGWLRGGGAEYWIPFYRSYIGAEGGWLIPIPWVLALYAAVGFGFQIQRGGKGAGSAIVACLLASLMEAARAFLGAPVQVENILLASLAATLGALAARGLARQWSERQFATNDQGASPARMLWQGSRRLLQVGAGMASIGLALAGAWFHPIAPIGITLVLVTYVILLWRFPRLWLWAIPAAVPVLAFSNWTGRIYFDEADILVLATLGVGFLRILPMPVQWRLSTTSNLLVALVTVSYLASALIGLRPLPPVDLNAFTDYASHFNSLRLLKGFLWALAMLPLLQRSMDGEGHAFDRWLMPGMLSGLAAVSAVGWWERWAFPGLMDFSQGYRITATFPEMHVGGAALDGYWVLSFPFLVAWLLSRRQPGGMVFGSAFSLFVAYALIATFAGSFIGERSVALAVKEGVQARLEHWGGVISLRDGGLKAWLLGNGLGRFPRDFHWHSRQDERPPGFQFSTDADLPSPYRWGPLEYQPNQGGEAVYLALTGGGEPLRYGQRISLAQGNYTLMVRSRTTSPGAKLGMEICDQWVSYPMNCSSQVSPVPDKKGWQEIRMNFTASPGGWAGPTRAVSVFNATAGTRIEIDKVGVFDGAGHDLVRNGNFSQGSQYWFSSSDRHHLPWHAENMWLHVWLEQGWLGVVAFVLLLIVALKTAWQSWKRGDAVRGVLAFSLTGFAVLSIFHSLLDVPRLACLFFFLIWLALPRTRPRRNRDNRASR